MKFQLDCVIIISSRDEIFHIISPLVSSGFEALRENKLKYVNNPWIGYLNINSLRNKKVDLREMILELSLDYLVLSETKLDHSSPTAQFYIKEYEVRAGRGRDKHGTD